MKAILITLLALSLLPAISHAAPRDELALSGNVSDHQGNPLEGSQSMTFRIYASSEGGDPVWQETQTVPFNQGAYSVALGSVNPMEDKVFEDGTLYLGVQIDGDTEMTPRVVFHSVPWAKKADTAVMALSVNDDVPLNRLLIKGVGEVINSKGGWVGSTAGFQQGGTQGVKGDQGIQGPAGPTGPAGTTGLQGLKGDTGAIGAQGLQGLKGDKGDTGSTGLQGAQGLIGLTGATGPQGVKGDTGLQGLQGWTGLTGAQGLQGLKGDKGDTGATGPQGPKGDSGNSGSTLVTGTTVDSASGASVGTQVTGTASCGSGKVLLGGGASVTTTETGTNKKRAILVSSYPSSTTTWTAIGMVSDAGLSSGKTISVTAYAFCSL